MLSDTLMMKTWMEFDNECEVTNISTLLDDNPDAFDGSNLHIQFFDLWKNSQTPLAEIPLQYCNICTKTTQKLKKLKANLIYQKGLPNVKNLSEILNLEKNTWALMSALYIDRFETDLKTSDSETGDVSQFNHSEKEIIRLLYEKDVELRETQMLIDWLERLVREQIEEVAEKYECLFNQTIVWENTAHLLDYLSQSEIKERHLVKGLHPDAVVMTGDELDHKDQLDNDRYLNYLFLCIRGGDLRRAQLLCTQRGEFWRAISLEGWRPFHYTGYLDVTNLSVNNEDVDASDDNMLVSEQSDCMDQSMWKKPSILVDNYAPTYKQFHVEGNPMRILYKSACWWNAENINLRPFERAIYATLSGNLNALSCVLPASWTDQTWAHCRALVEARVDSSLRSLLNTGPRANTLAVTGRSFKYWPLDAGLSLPDNAWSPGDWTLSDVFNRVDNRIGWSALGYLRNTSEIVMKTVRRSALNDFLLDDTSHLSMTDDYDSQTSSVYILIYCIFYATQQAVMLRDYESFLTAIANIMPKLVSSGLGLNCSVDNTTHCMKPPSLTKDGHVDAVVCHVLRFLAHLVLFLKSAEPDIQDEPCAEILKGYISFLMFDKRIDLIAYYTSHLPDELVRIHWYSWFLAEINQPSDREYSLSVAVTAGFDLRRLTRAVVRLLRQRLPVLGTEPRNTISSNLLDKHDLPADIGLGTLLQDEQIGKLTEADRRRIVAMDWLFYDPAQRGEALVVANSLLRVFVAMHSFKAARQVLSKLPTGTLEQAKLICKKSGSPGWLINTIREHECLILYLESRDAFADWFQQVHSNRPIQPSLSKTSSNSIHTYGPRGLAQRLVLEESKKDFEARLEKWRHDVQLDTEVAAEKLLALLAYSNPGWLVDLDLPSGPDSLTDITENINTAEQGNVELTDIQFDDYRKSSNFHDLIGLGENASSRQSQMSVLRESCITETVFLIVRLFQTAGLHQRCIELVNLIVDKDHNLFMATLTDLQNDGWNISQKSFTQLAAKITTNSPRAWTIELLNSDIRVYVTPWIADQKKNDSLEANGRIVQITRIRNLAIPQNEQGFGINSRASTGRLLRLILTDGRISIPALDMDNHPDLSIDTPPGTKLRLLNVLPISTGFILLHKNNFNILGGLVSKLIDEWNLTKFANCEEARNSSKGAPLFVAFDSQEARNLVRTEEKFLKLLSNQGPNHESFDSFKLATKKQSTEENVHDADFQERRKTVIAELNNSDYSRSDDQYNAPSTRRFRPGGSKFAELLAQKAFTHDQALAQLLAAGYPIYLANNALKLNGGDYQKAQDYLLSKSLSNVQIESNSISARSRGRTNRGHDRGRGRRVDRSGPDGEDDINFDYVAESSKAGLPPRRATGFVPIDELIVNPTSKPSSSMDSTHQPGSSSLSRPHCLPVGCPILAQNMSGNYEEATLIGHLTLPNINDLNNSGEKVVLVVYNHSSADNNDKNSNGRTKVEEEEDEEIVPLSLIRTLNRERISIDMVPQAPPDRAKPYFIPFNNMSNEQSNNVKPTSEFATNTFGRSRGVRRGRGRGRSSATFRGRRNPVYFNHH